MISHVQLLTKYYNIIIIKTSYGIITLNYYFLLQDLIIIDIKKNQMVFRKIQNYYKYVEPLYRTDKFGNRYFIITV